MRANIMMLWGDQASQAMSQAVQEVLGDLAVAFGHSFVFREERFAEASIQSYDSPMTQETVDACLESNAVLAVSRTGEGLMALAAGLSAIQGSFHYDFPACLQPNSLLKSDALPRGCISYPLSVEAQPLKSAMRIALRQAGQSLRHIPMAGRSRSDWEDALRQAMMDVPAVKVSTGETTEILQLLIEAPDSLGHLFAPPTQALVLDSAARAVSGLQSLVRERFTSDRPIVFASRILGELPDGDGPFGLLYAAADMLAGALKLPREAECLRTSTTNVLDAGWRTPDIAVAGSPRIGTSAICGLIREQISLAGQLLTH